MSEKWIVHPIAPIDSWVGWMTKEQYAESMASDFAGPSKEGALQRIDEMVRQAEEAAAGGSWEGDYRQGPYFAGLPGHDGDAMSKVMIAWKQDNNGTTFIASPYRLPWLDQ